VSFVFGLLLQLWLKAELAKKADSDSGPVKEIRKLQCSTIMANTFLHYL